MDEMRGGGQQEIHGGGMGIWAGAVGKPQKVPTVALAAGTYDSHTCAIHVLLKPLMQTQGNRNCTYVSLTTDCCAADC